MTKLYDLFKGNDDAVQLFHLLREISHTWDDLIDKDKPVTDTQVHRAFWIALIGLRKNRFYVAFEADLLPALEVGILNFVASVELERWPGHPRQLAHTARYSAGDVCLIIARLVGGLDWALKVAPEIKLLTQTDTFDDFDTEMEAKYGTTQNDPAA